METKKMIKTTMYLLAVMLVTPIERTDLFTINNRENYLTVRALLQHWTKMKTHPRRITVILHDDANHPELYIAPAIFRELGNAVSIASLEHVMSLGRKSGRADFRAVESGSCVILLCPNISDIERVLEAPHLSSFWHPENFYILRETVQDSTAPSVDWNRHFLKWALMRLWRLRRIYKIAVSIGSKLIRYDPFDYGNYSYSWAECKVCDGETEAVSRLRVEEENEADVSQYCYDYREDFDGYPIRVSIFESPTMTKIGNQYSGLDYKYLEVITRKMNVTTTLLESELGYGYKENGVFRGPLGDLVYNRADVTFNQFYVKDYETEEIQVSVTLTSDKLCLLVPRAMPIPEHLVIARTFSPGSWLLVLLGHLVISILYSIMKDQCTNYSDENIDRLAERMRAKRTFEYELEDSSVRSEKYVPTRGRYPTIAIPQTGKEEYYEVGRKSLEAKASTCCTREEKRRRKRSGGFEPSYVGGFLSLGKYLTKVILQLVQPLQGARARTSERVLLISSLIMSLILNGVFTSELASLFTKLSYYEDLHTLEDVDLSGTKLLLLKRGIVLLTESRDLMDDALTDPDSTILGHLRQKLQLANASELRRRIFDSHDAGYLQRKSTMPLKITKFQKERVHLVEECPRQYNIALLITKGSPFLLRINTLLGWLNSAGFYDKWFHDMSVELTRTNEDEELPEIRLKLTMRHLAIPFLILFIGILCSSVAFIFERKYGPASARAIIRDIRGRSFAAGIVAVENKKLRGKN